MSCGGKLISLPLGEFRQANKLAATKPMSYRTIIGLEVHVQLLTQTKLFCGCSTRFGLPPNSATCPICVGMPGTMPVMNRTAFRLALKAALALNCEIAPFTKWDRKNYYYPDLPKNYQISQYDLPFSHDGWLDIETAAGAKKVGIIRAHLEEDAGKMLHDEAGAKRDSLVDLNRTGTPLLEIVSQPEMETAEEAKAYLEEIRLLLKEIGVSDCEMQEGSLRCDANVNLHVPHGDLFLATPIIEIKNLNSFRGVERAIKYEAERQHTELAKKLGKEWTAEAKVKSFRDYRVAGVLEKKPDGRAIPVSKATAGWDDRLGRTEVQRRKEEASDYRYFPEPDLVPVTVSATQLDEARRELGELPSAQRARLQTQYGLSAYDAGVLSHHGRPLVAFFEEAVRICGDAKEACNWIANDVLQMLNERGITIGESPISAAGLGGLIAEIKATGLNKQRAREVYAEMLTSGSDVKAAIAKLGIVVVADEGQLRDIVRRAIAANAKAVADFKKGKVKAADAIKGAVMRETKGMAKMEQVQKLLIEELEKV
jgi:aspartyl-tRNA(Asn)/glutamyl-tRNA(Gln) amidotransferase subunit B